MDRERCTKMTVGRWEAREIAVVLVLRSEMDYSMWSMTPYNQVM